MFEYFLPATSRKQATYLHLLSEKGFRSYISKAPVAIKSWVEAHGFKSKPGMWIALPATKGKISEIVVIVEDSPGIWSLSGLPAALPQGVYRLRADGITPDAMRLLLIGWGLGCYSFHYFKSTQGGAEPPQFSSLILPPEADAEELTGYLAAHWLVRDLVNAPPNALGPSELVEEAQRIARKHGAKTEVTVGEELTRKNYPAVYEVGKACDDAPRMIDLRWGKASHTKITLVGKGVCFDSGGLNIKSASNMLLMKKDMGGAAHVLALAQMIMQAKLPVYLRVLIPAVENSISGNAFRPLDVINTRKGLTVEIGNTDAEGRLILCDALYEADSEKPALIIDCATLTGAARVALGTDMPAFFTPSETLAGLLQDASQAQQDPLWRLPLHMGYDDVLKSTVADLSSTGTSAYGGAITAALFLRRFVTNTPDWVHVDMMAWNLGTRPGRPAGGEAMGLRALYALVKKYASK